MSEENPNSDASLPILVELNKKTMASIKRKQKLQEKRKEKEQAIVTIRYNNLPSLLTPFYGTENHVTHVLHKYLSSKDQIHMAHVCLFLYQRFRVHKIPLTNLIKVTKIVNCDYHRSNDKKICYVTNLHLHSRSLPRNHTRYKKLFPEGLLQLKLQLRSGLLFPSNVDMFPSSLIKLDIMSVMDIPDYIDIRWPPKLNHLLLSQNLHRKLPRSLPISIETLYVKGFLVDTSIPNQLSSLTRLKRLEFDFLEVLHNNRILPTQLPASITELTLTNLAQFPFTAHALPSSLTRLSLSGWYTQPALDDTLLPLSLKHLELCSTFRANNSVDIQHLLQLKSVKFGSCFSDHVQFPVSTKLLKISFGTSYNYPNCKFQHISNLRYLNFGDHFFNQPISTNTLPSSLRVLILSTHFNQVIDPNVLPSCLEYLSFDSRNGTYNHPLCAPGIIPSSLKVLLLSNTYSYPLQLCHTNLVYLRLGNSFSSHVLDDTCLPSTISYIVIGQQYHYSYTSTMRAFPNLVYFGGNVNNQKTVHIDPFASLILPHLYM